MANKVASRVVNMLTGRANVTKYNGELQMHIPSDNCSHVNAKSNMRIGIILIRASSWL